MSVETQIGLFELVSNATIPSSDIFLPQSLVEVRLPSGNVRSSQQEGMTHEWATFRAIRQVVSAEDQRLEGGKILIRAGEKPEQLGESEKIRLRLGDKTFTSNQNGNGFDRTIVDLFNQAEQALNKK